MTTYDDLVPKQDDLIDTGVAYLRLKNAADKALNQLAKIRTDPEIDVLVRSDILQVILILREALE